MTKTLLVAVHGLSTLTKNMSLKLTGRTEEQIPSFESQFVAVSDKIDKTFDGVDIQVKDMELKTEKSIESAVKKTWVA